MYVSVLNSFKAIPPPINTRPPPLPRRTDAPSNDAQRLDAILSGLVDVQTIMQTMPNAIRAAVKVAQE